MHQVSIFSTSWRQILRGILITNLAPRPELTTFNMEHLLLKLSTKKAHIYRSRSHSKTLHRMFTEIIPFHPLSSNYTMLNVMYCQLCCQFSWIDRLCPQQVPHLAWALHHSGTAVCSCFWKWGSPVLCCAAWDQHAFKHLILKTETNICNKLVLMSRKFSLLKCIIMFLELSSTSGVSMFILISIMKKVEE